MGTVSVKLQDQGSFLLTSIFLFRNDDGTPFPSDSTVWLNLRLQSVNNALLEFIAAKKNESTGEDLAPSTLRGHLCGIQRGFLIDWGHDVTFLSGEVFSDKKTGVLAALDNKVPALHEEGAFRKSHKVF